MIRVVGLAGISIFAVMWLLGELGARVNTTGSIPVGIYWKIDGVAMPGDYVMFCPPAAEVFSLARARGYIGAGECDGGYEKMMKRLAGVGGDTLDVTDSGLRVNGALIPKTRRLVVDPTGRRMPVYSAHQITVAPGAMVLVSVHDDRGFDARYFGPLHLRSPIERLRPIWTFGRRNDP